MPLPTAPPTITPELLADLDTTVPAAMITFDIPGAAIALVQDGQVVYAKGFGVRNRTTGAPFTPDTVHRIGSAAKSMTSMLVATQVDAGLLEWDTPVRSIYPDFQLPTPELTSRTTVRQLMGMGTGLGEHPIGLYFDRLTPRRFVAGLATLPVLFPPGTAFHYNNPVYAMGGYVGALARGVPIPRLLRAYTAAMKAHLFDPIGMPTTAVTDHPDRLSDNYAVSYGYHLPDGVIPRYELPFLPLRAGAPSGAVGTTLHDMARYVITQLNGGLAPNGTRIVSAQNLTETWQPQTPVTETSAYGMGWGTAHVQGVHLLNHTGSVDAFRTVMTLFPDAKIGILIFANSESGDVFNNAIWGYVFETLYGLPATAFESNAAAYQQRKEALQELRASVTSWTVRRADVAPYLGAYDKGWRVAYRHHDHTLWLTRRSGYRLVLLPTAAGYLIGSGYEESGLGMLVTFATGEDGTMRMTMTQGGTVIDTLAQLKGSK
jgi:CubicO group peptidase (beta-lactamase class C family)